MTKKERPHNGRQKLFKDYYCEGKTKGNIEQSMLKANYSKSYARHYNNKMLANKGIREGIGVRKAEIEQVEQITIESINIGLAKQLTLCIAAKDRPSAIRVLENQAKHVGYYREDNLQTTQQRELSASELEAAQQIAAIANREGIKLHEPEAEGPAKAVG